jgi:hypothetical protein
MFLFDQWHIFGKSITTKATDGGRRSSVEKNKNSANGMAQIIADLEDDADVARSMVIGLSSVGIALLIVASFNDKEVPFLVKAAAEVPIAISIWTFWTASNGFKGQSKKQWPPRIFPNSSWGVIASMQILCALATGLLIWHL